MQIRGNYELKSTNKIVIKIYLVDGTRLGTIYLTNGTIGKATNASRVMREMPGFKVLRRHWAHVYPFPFDVYHFEFYKFRLNQNTQHRRSTVSENFFD